MLYNTKQNLPENWGLVINSITDCSLVYQIMINLKISNSCGWSFDAAASFIYIFSKGTAVGCKSLKNFKHPSNFLFFTVQEFLTKKPKNIEIY